MRIHVDVLLREGFGRKEPTTKLDNKHGNEVKTGNTIDVYQLYNNKEGKLVKKMTENIRSKEGRRLNGRRIDQRT